MTINRGGIIELAYIDMFFWYSLNSFGVGSKMHRCLRSSEERCAGDAQMSISSAV